MRRLLYTRPPSIRPGAPLFRRVSFRSALSASLATRMVPILIRDSKRLADAQRCRPVAAVTASAHARREQRRA